MDISTALAADLKDLLRVLDLPDLDVGKSLRALRFDVQLTVPSFVGLSMTLVVEGQRVTLTSVDDEGDFPPIASSLRLPVVLTAAVAAGSDLVLYATAPGAFVDLAADLAFALSAVDGDLRLDEDLTPTSRHSGLTGVAELSMINRALGVLIGRGLTPTQARSQLEGQARRSRVQTFQVAAQLISTAE